MEVTVFNTFNLTRGTINLEVKTPSGGTILIPNKNNHKFSISKSDHLTVNVKPEGGANVENYSVYVKDQPNVSTPTFKVQVNHLNGTEPETIITDLQSSTAPAVSVGDDEQ